VAAGQVEAATTCRGLGGVLGGSRLEAGAASRRRLRSWEPSSSEAWPRLRRVGVHSFFPYTYRLLGLLGLMLTTKSKPSVYFIPLTLLGVVKGTIKVA
jgi:uncharacterized membrane protein